eukprot:173843_1
MSTETAEELFTSANELFVDEDFEGSLEKLDAAIELDGKNPTYFLHRAANHLKLEKYADALADASKCLELKPYNATAHFRSGLANFHLDQFELAKQSFEQAKSLGNKKSDLWIRKCSAEIEDAKSGASEVRAAKKQPKPTPLEESSESEPPCRPKSVRYTSVDYDKTFSFVIMIKGLAQPDVTVDFEEKSFKVSAKLPYGGKFEKEVDLAHTIVPAESSVKVNKYKIIINLQKAAPICRWKSAESGSGIGEGVQIRENILTENSDIATKYPSSGKKEVDWEKLDQEAKKDQEDEKVEGDQALNQLFQKIYKDSDEDTRRAMIKSMQTSGGTVLSTNWKEVREADYEKDVQAPSGSEVHRWEQEM